MVVGCRQEEDIQKSFIISKLDGEGGQLFNTLLYFEEELVAGHKSW